MEENKILEKIRKLLAVTKENGASEGEVENAMKLAQRLMMQHNIEASELELSPLDIDELIIENSFLSGEPKYWIWDLLGVVGESYSCEIFKQVDRLTGNSFYRVVGMNEDRIIVNELFLMLLPIVRNLTHSRWKEYVKKVRNGLPETLRELTLADLMKHKLCSSKSVFTGSYINGFLIGLRARLKQDKENYFTLPSEKEQYGLIVIRKDDLIKSYIKDNVKPKEVKPRGQVEINASAYFLGKEDGLEESINKQLQS